MAKLHRVVRNLRALFSSPVSQDDIAACHQEIISLRGEAARQREEIARLRALKASPGADALTDRFRQLENLLTEHPQTDSRGSASISFPSPAVSVVMPAWNRAAFISDAIRSVQAQHFTDWELLVIDDGSTDDTAQIVAAFAGDSRIRYVQQTHAGHSRARNQGLRLACGSLIAYLDTDNLWYPGFLAAAVTAFAADQTIHSAYGALVTDAHGADLRILFQPFDHAELLKGNFIDLNTFVHRRSLVEARGEFDETLDRLVDWDLILRYTQTTPPRRLPVLAARYRVLDEQRVSNQAPCGLNFFRIQRKWRTSVSFPRPPRVLYVLWHYPHLSETYIETEILCLKRWGIHVEVWAEYQAASPYEPSVPVHRGTLAQAIAACQPDILHVHWLNIAVSHGPEILASGLPFTVRAHGFDVTDEGIRALLALPALRRAFFFPHQLANFPGEPRLIPMTCAFETSLFPPEPDKDRHLVIRTSAGLPKKDLEIFFETAKLLPDHRFVMAAVTCLNQESYIGELTSALRRSGSPAELMIDVPRDKLAKLVRRAGFYVHTVTPADAQGGAPIGMPVSITEAMATGAHALVRDIPPLNSYFGPVASVYRDARHAAETIAEVTAWPEAKWKQAWTKSVDLAYLNHADETVLRPLFDEWCVIFRSQGK